MKFVKKLISSPVLWLALLSLVYWATRLANLTSLPIFTDEAIYIRWAQIGGRDASWRFISLTDGKQPLFTWLAMATVRFARDPLFGGRLASCITGFIAMFGMYALGSEIFKRKSIGVVAAFLYVIFPFSVMYDRMALYDSLVAALSIWNLYLAVLLVRKVRLDVALLLGMGLGLGMLNKTSGFMSLYFLPLTVLLFDFKKPKVIRRLLGWIGYAAVAAILSQIIYSILRLSPFFYIVAQKDTIFVYPLNEWVTHPFRFFVGNFHGEFEWVWNYLSIPLTILAFGATVIRFSWWREKALLLLWWLAPISALALFGKVLYPRFVLFMTMPLVVLAAYAMVKIWERLKSKWAALVILSLVCIPNIYMSSQILLDIKHAKIPVSDRGQYIDDWPSGWGVREIVAFLGAESKDKKIAVFTDGTFGLFPYALEIYLVDNPNIKIQGIWPLPAIMPAEMNETARTMPTYFVLNMTQNAPALWSLKLLSEYDKGTNNGSKMRLFEVLPKPAPML